MWSYIKYVLGLHFRNINLKRDEQPNRKSRKRSRSSEDRHKHDCCSSLVILYIRGEFGFDPHTRFLVVTSQCPCMSSTATRPSGALCLHSCANPSKPTLMLCTQCPLLSYLPPSLPPPALPPPSLHPSLPPTLPPSLPPPPSLPTSLPPSLPPPSLPPYLLLPPSLLPSLPPYLLPSLPPYFPPSLPPSLPHCIV